MSGGLRRDLFHFLRGIAKQNGAAISWGFSDPEAGYPRIVLRLTMDRPEQHTRGPSAMSTADVQISAYAKATQDRSASKIADTIADSIAGALDGYVGPLGEETFCACAELTERYQVEEQAIDSGDWLFGMVLEFTISHGVSVRH